MAESAEIAPIAALLLSSTTKPKRDGHIVDIMIEERCPSWVRALVLAGRSPVLFSMLGYRKALRWADEIKKLPSGDACFAYLDKALDLRVTSTGLEHVPRTGRNGHRLEPSNRPCRWLDRARRAQACPHRHRDHGECRRLPDQSEIRRGHHPGRMGAGQAHDRQDQGNPAPRRR
jgi:hypothetical protein